MKSPFGVNNECDIEGGIFMKIGLPRGLLYYSYEPFLRTFFGELPVDVEISAPTDQSILDKGTASCIGEACLPVKVFSGHIESLRERCDRIAVLRIMNSEYGESFCPKLNGLPELTGGKEDFVFTEPVDFSDPKALFHSLCRPCKKLGIRKKDVKKAFRAAVDDWKKSRRGLCVTDRKYRVFLAGHSYNIGDSFVNMDLLRKLEYLDIGVITEQAVDRVYKEQYLKELVKKPFWSNFTSLYGAARYLEEQNMIDGIICLSSVSCGTDSVVAEMIRENTDLPVLVLKLDEMTGEAGFDTRLEAFCEVLAAGKRGESA